MLPVAVTVAIALAATDPAPVYKIGVEHDGVYQLAYEDLGLSAGVLLDSRRLAMSHGGEAVPMLVLDGGDRRFGPGDALRFVGEHPAGERSWFSEHTRHNVYWLTQGDEALRYQSRRVKQPRTDRAASAFRHLEQDTIRVRFRPRADQVSPEIWYWERLSHLDREPFSHPVDLPPGGGLSLAVGLRGWSTAGPGLARGTAQHRAELRLNGSLVGAAEWDGQEATEIRVDDIDPALLQPEGNTLTISVPRRVAPGESDPVIDVVLLNWIEIRHPIAAAEGQQILTVGEDPARVEVGEGQQLELYGPDGQHLQLGGRKLRAELSGAGRWHAVQGAQYRSPAWVVADHSVALRDSSRQADYLMIGHRSLLAAATPLAEFHRRRGLEVDVIDVDDVYDAFSHGVVTPQAIRDFIAYAAKSWKRPAPRYVLLIGDASWDVHNDELDDRNYADWTFRPGETKRFRKNGSTPYAQQIAQRNLVPTWSVETYEGHAASDNPFVDVVGDDGKPDLAIGRLPVATPGEVSAIVDKIIAYAELSTVGPWRRNILWITNEEAWFQRVSDNLVGHLDGFAATRVYPSPDEKDNAAHQQFLRSAFDEGQLLVHFIGHGGRYIWRTGPPDLRKNHDLFTLDDVDALSPTRQLPMILSMTCYSAPFDHPTADSIGEKFLRLPDRGAIAVFAASWRNSPTERFSRELMEALTRPGLTIGEAILQAKQEEPSKVMVETYNLLGDPALALALPSGTLALTAQREERQVVVQGVLGVDVEHGRIIVDWLDAQGQTVASAERDQQGADFTLALDGEPAQRAVGARVYFWNATERVDAFGTVAFNPVPGETVAAGTADTNGADG